MMLSALIALSLTPALCALILKPKKDEAEIKGFIGKAVHAFNKWFERTLAKYVTNVEKCIRHAKVVMACLLVGVILIGFLFKITPSGYVPNEDMGMSAVSFSLPEGASSNRNIQLMGELSKEVQKFPGVDYVMEVSGVDILSSAQKASAGLGLGPKFPDATVMAFQPPALPGASSTGSLSMYIMNLGGEDVSLMNDRAQEFLAKARQRPEIGMIYTTLNTTTPMYKFNVDRDKAQSLNVPVSSVFSALQTFLGGYEINDLNNFGRTWKVVMQADDKYRSNVDDMRYFFVRSNDGTMVPLNTLVTYDNENSSVVMTRFNGARAIKIAGDPAEGYSTGQAMTALCLAALYESWTIPLAVLLSVPTAVLGCILGQYLRGQQNDVYMQIGLIMLIGLAAKNAILIVEYAKMNMEKGMGVVDAAVEASRLRLRPILMTSFAFILGCLPLAVATGPGAGARVSMGNAVVAGMTFNTN